jgi:hypothetical protein
LIARAFKKEVDINVSKEANDMFDRLLENITKALQEENPKFQKYKFRTYIFE